MFASLDTAKYFYLILENHCQQVVRQLGKIPAVINTKKKICFKCPLLSEFGINNCSRRILERILVGNIVNILDKKETIPNYHL